MKELGVVGWDMEEGRRRWQGGGVREERRLGLHLPPTRRLSSIVCVCLCGFVCGG